MIKRSLQSLCAVFTISLLLYAPTSYADRFANDASLLDEDMADITDWTDGDAINGVSTQATFDSQSTMKMESNTADTGNVASRVQDIGSIPDVIMATIRVYLDSVGARAGPNGLQFYYYNEDGDGMFILLASDGLYAYDGAAWELIDANGVTQDAWVTYDFISDYSTPASATTDIYMNGELLVTGVDTSYETSGTDGTTTINLLGYTVDDQIAYVDYVKIGDEYAVLPSTEDCFGGDCRLMLSLDGADGATSTTDESASEHTITFNDNAQLDTAQKKFGTASALFDGTDDYLSAPDSADFNLGSDDFTIDGWFRLPAVDTIYRLVGQWQNAGASESNGWAAWLGLAGGDEYLSFQYSTDGTTNIPVSQLVTGGISINTWHHFAFVRSGSNFYTFLDGTQVATTYDISTDIIFNSTDVLAIGALHNDTSWTQEMDGWIDELRIVKGTAVWTSNFDVPTSAYSACADGDTKKCIIWYTE